MGEADWLYHFVTNQTETAFYLPVEVKHLKKVLINKKGNFWCGFFFPLLFFT